MSGVDQLVALGFESYWVKQALELTNFNTNYAMEWLLSDEFKLAKQAYEQFNRKTSENTHKNDIQHAGGPSLQVEASPAKKLEEKRISALKNEQEFEIEYNLEQPDLKPVHSIMDLNIDQIFKKPKRRKSTDDDILSDDDPALNHLLQPSLDIQLQHTNSDMNDFMAKLKNQVQGSEWLCHACGANVSTLESNCNICNASKICDTDWICPVCTFVNAEDTLVCEMCLSTNMMNSLNKYSSSHDIVSLAAEQTWSCAACEYHNTQTNACRMCGFEKGQTVTKQHSNDNDDDDDVEEPNEIVLQSSSHLSNIEVPKDDDWKVNEDPQRSPSKQVSADSLKNVFDEVGDEPLPDVPKHKIQAKYKIKKKKKADGGQVMLQRVKKHKKQEEEEDEESSSLSEVVGNIARSKSDVADDEEEDYIFLQCVQKRTTEKTQSNRTSVIGAVADVADKGDDEDDVLPFKDFDIPMMDEFTDLAFDNKPKANDPSPVIINAQSNPSTIPKEQPSKAESELTGFAALKAMYAGQSQKQKIKLKLKIGAVVDIYSASKQDWIEGVIKEIKGDLICIVYGRKMKWLKKNSRQLRPKQQMVSDALAKQQQKLNQSQKKQEQSSHKKQEHKPQMLHSSVPSALALASAPAEDEAPPAYSALTMNNNPPLLQAQQDMFNSVIAKEAAVVNNEVFQPPPPMGPPPAFVPEFGYDANMLNQPSPMVISPQKAFDDNSMKKRPNEFDYDVTFTTSVLGLELYPDKDGKNCIVGKCLSKTAKKFVDPGSIIVKVNDMWVVGLSYDMVRDAVKQGARHPPLKIMFRVKLNNVGKQKKKQFGNERGYLKVKVVAGVQLKHRASYCVVQVGNARLSTREVQRNEHPEWQEMLTFKNFRPDNNKSAVVSVYDHSTILKDKKIGTVEYVLPVEFNKLQRDTLELKTSKGKLSGVIILNTIIVHKTNSIKHLRKY